MLRILFLSPFLPHIGVHSGAGRLFSLITRLSQRYNISILSYLPREEERQYMPELEKYCQRVKVVPQKTREQKSFFHNFSPRMPFYHYYTQEMKQELLNMFKEEDFDILQIEYSEMAHYIFFTPPMPTALTVHEPSSQRIFDLFKYETRLSRKIPLLLDYMSSLNFEMHICKRFDAIINVTENDRRLFSSFSPNINSFVINTGVDTSYFKPSNIIREEPNTLLYVGYFGHYPNVDAVLYFCRAILPLIRKEVPEIKLYIAGSFPTPEVLNLANENIIVTGRVEDLRPYYESAQVLIAPIRIGGGIRSKIVEAWAMQKPVVATPLAVNGIGAIDGENIFIANREEDFAKRTILLLKNEGLRKKMGLAGRKIVEQRFDWDIIADRLGGLYQELATSKARQARCRV